MARKRHKQTPKLWVPPRLEKDTVPASSIVGREKIAEAVDEMRKRGELPDNRMHSDNEGVDHTQVRLLRVNPVCWGIPWDEVCFSKWAKHMLGRVRIMPWDDTSFAGSTYLPDARNMIHARYLEQSNCQFLMMLDSDVIPPPGFDHQLLKHMENPEIKMVGGWYRRKGDPYNPVVYHWHDQDADGVGWWKIYDEDEIKTGLEEVEGAGAGCWLMHRSVAEAIGPKPYNMNEGGEDLHLCQKVKAAGFKLWIDWDIACAHAGVAVA